jgi:hypothetical protein
MPDVSFRTLVLDSVDAPALADFWSRLAQVPLVAASDGDLLVQLVAGAEGLFVDEVPEPRSGRTRVRIDLQLPDYDVAPLVAQGATLVAEPRDGAQWWVLNDPEGNELRAMPPPPPELHVPYVLAPTVYQLCVDSADPEALAQWWAERTGGTARSRRGASWWWVDGAAGFPWMFWMFTAQAEPRTAKNRLHWDVWLDGDSPQPLLDAGATLLREPADASGWWVLADPEGNEFCAFPAASRP